MHETYESAKKERGNKKNIPLKVFAKDEQELNDEYCRRD
jgi:hypothetical protein